MGPNLNASRYRPNEVPEVPVRRSGENQGLRQMQNKALAHLFSMQDSKLALD